MTTRPLEIADFLNRNGWNRAVVQPLEADFSPRRYARLTKENGETAFLMDADPDQKTPLFITIADILRRADIRAPQIYAAEADKGLVLMEDFGLRNVGALIDSGESPLPYFLRAAEVLALVHRKASLSEDEKKALPSFHTGLFVEQAGLFLDDYFPVAEGREASEEERLEFNAAWKAVLTPLEKLPQSLLLRDFMPDNLMALPENQLGVLDFQDAGIGPVAYDLESLCEEVRRDGGYALLPEVLAHYRALSTADVSEKELRQACAVLSAQRHMRILGIIVRLSKKTGRCDKFVYLPRIRKHLDALLKEHCLIPVRAWIDAYDEILK